MGSFCEHCGDVGQMKVYEDDGTSWCKYCMEANGKLCSQHPRYRILSKPTGNCEMCWRLWINKQDGKQELEQNAPIQRYH